MVADGLVGAVVGQPAHAVPGARPVRRVPGEEELEVAGLAGLQRRRDPQRAGPQLGQVLGRPAQLRAALQGLRLGFEPTVGGEVVPEQLDAVLPEVDRPLRGDGRSGVRGGEGGGADVHMIIGEIGAELQAGEALGPPFGDPGTALEHRHLEHVVVHDADRGGHRAGDGDVDRSIQRVVHRVAQHRPRDAGRVDVEGHQRGERLQPHLDRQLLVGELDRQQRVLTAHPARVETGQSGDLADVVAGVALVRRTDPGLEDPADGLAVLRAGADGEEGEGQPGALVGVVGDLPVPELAAGPDRDVAGADATERERRRSGLGAQHPRSRPGGRGAVGCRSSNSAVVAHSRTVAEIHFTINGPVGRR